MRKEKDTKNLVLRDLSARLTYGVMCDRLGQAKKLLSVAPDKEYCLVLDNGEYTPNEYKVEDVKPYLRHLSSMTKEEAEDMFKAIWPTHRLIKTEVENDRVRYYACDDENGYAGHRVIFFNRIHCLEHLEWLLEHHFDFRGLIEKGLALKATNGMYGYESC